MAVGEAELGDVGNQPLPPPSTAGVLVLPGARLAYEVSGEGPAVVLVHGFGLDMRMWDAQVRHLAGSFRVVRYDCRGFGASGPFDPAAAYTHAADLIALLDHLRLGQAVLAGLSFGGRVVMQAALAAPHRVRGLVLLDAVLDGVRWDPDRPRRSTRPPGRRRLSGFWPAGPPGWRTRCSRPPASSRRWRASWPRWSAVTPGSTGPAPTLTSRPGRSPSTRWKICPCRSW